MKKRFNRKSSALARCIESLESRVLLSTNKLVFLSQPTNSVAGTTVAPVIQVAVETPGGAIVTSDTSTVTIAFDTDTVDDGVTLSGTLTAAAVKGVATFTDLSVNSINGQNPIQLTATDGSLTAGESAEFNILPAAPSAIVFDDTLGNATAGTTHSTIIVDLEDKFGNLADINSSKVALSIATGPTGATMGGNVTAYITDGQAFFEDISFETAGTYTLSAKAGNFIATSSSFTINPGTAKQVAFGTAPVSGTAGTLPSVTAQIEDVFGNVVTGNTSKVTLAIGTGPNGGTLGGTLQQNASAGVATFGDLALQKAGTYTITATDGSLTGTTSAPITMSAGAATKLAFVQAPSAAKAGAVISPAITVAVEDQFGNIVTTDKSKITVALGTSPDGSKLTGTAIIAAASGVATFSTLSLATAGSYTITVADGSLTGATSSSFTISPGDATQLVYGTAPVAATAGAALTAFTVKVEDKFGNVVTGNSSSVTVGIGTGPIGAAVTGTATVAASSGVATFSVFKLRTAGNYTLKATDGALTPVTSAAVPITADVAAKLAISAPPASVVAGAAIPPVTVSVEDQFGNVETGDTSSVTIAIADSTGPDGAALSGTLTAAAVKGVAIFTGLSLNLAGSGDSAYQLDATDASLTHSTSSSFAVTAAAAAQLAFKKNPGDAHAGAVDSPNVTVMVEDKFGNLVTTDASKITLSVATGPSITPPKKIGSKSKKVKASSTLPALGGTVTVAAVSGLATFTDLTLPTTGTYTLAALDGKLTAATSSSFAISAGTAAQIAFGTQPLTAAAGGTLAALTAQVEDAFGNVVTTDTSKITVAIASGPDGATFTATKQVTAIAGVSTFGDLVFNTAGTYTLTATDASLAAGTSAAFIITPGAATKLAFGQQPSAVVAGSAIAPGVTVLVEDQFNNVVSTDASKITMGVGDGPDGAKLTGTSIIGAAKGVATFSGLSLAAAASYTLTASDGSLTGATSHSFSVTAGAAAKLAFAAAPSGTSAGNNLGEVDIDVEDKLGNIVTTDNSFVTISAATGPVGATLGAYATFRASSGVAAFTNLEFSETGAYTLKATDGALAVAASPAFTITPAFSAELAFTKSPSNAIAGNKIAPAVTVTMYDEFGNVNTDYSGNITVAIATGTGPSGATLGGTLTEAAVKGVATFADLTENAVGSYKLSASANFIHTVLSSAFTITPAAASQVVFDHGPANVTAGDIFASPITVDVEDKFGNLVTTDTSKVTISVVSPTGGTPLAGTLTLAAVGGVATFTDLGPYTAGATTFKAADGKLTPDTSDSFTVAPAAAIQVVFGTAPVATVAGVTMAAVTAKIEDSFGNVLAGNTSNVKIAINTGPDGGTFSGTATVAASAGVATFSDLKLNTAGPYTFSLSDGALVGATTAVPITITPAAASKVVFGQAPSDAVAGVAVGPTVTAQVEDAFNNVVTTDTSKVTISVNTGPTNAAITGTAQVAAVKGIATFTGISLSLAGTGYKLALADGSLTGATSSTFKVTPAAAAKLVFLQGPTAAAKTVVISPDVTVQVEDKFGNVVTTDTSNVTLAFATNTTSATLGGTLMVAADTGVATFDDLAVDKAGTYTIKATDGSLTLATSASFVISA